MNSPPRRSESRDMEIWRLRHHHNMTQAQISARVGISRESVSATLKRMARPVSSEERQAYVDQMREDLDWLRREAVKLVEAGPVPLYSNGRPVLDEQGNVVEDHAGRAKAMKTALEIQARLAQLLGTDAPAKIEATIDVREQEAATGAAAEAVARMAGREADGNE